MTRDYWLALLERAGKTAAQVAALVLIAQGFDVGDGVTSFDVRQVAWDDVAAYAAGGAILSALTSLGSGFLSERGTPSLTKAETLRYEGEHRAGEG